MISEKNGFITGTRQGDKIESNDNISVFCSSCDKEIKEDDLNELEKKELKGYGFFSCSDCVNIEMNEDNDNYNKMICEGLR